jgi:DeoR-like helix-turn-helix domain
METMTNVLQNRIETEKTIYQLAFEKHYRSLLGIVEFAIAKMADSAIEIASRAIALAAPLPNAINLSTVVINDLGWGQAAAVAFAITIEIAVFYLVEVALKQFDGYLEDPKRYRVPLVVMVTTLGVGAAVVMTLVYHLETHKIMTLLPIISICAFVGIGLQRWHDRNQGKLAQAQGEHVEALTNRISELTVKVDDYKQQSEHATEQLISEHDLRVKLEQDTAILIKQNEMLLQRVTGVQDEFERYRERAMKQLSEHAAKAVHVGKPSRKDDHKKSGKLDGTFERRVRVLDMWKDGTELSLKDAADQLGVSKTTISNDLGWLESAEVIHRQVNPETGKTMVTVNGKEAAFRSGQL